jgi:hypothetical protein
MNNLILMLAAALASKRYLAARGLRWRDITPNLLTAPEPPRAYRPHSTSRDWREVVCECLEPRAFLNAKEIEFLKCLLSFAHLSWRQTEWLNRIAAKVGVTL